MLAEAIMGGFEAVGAGGEGGKDELAGRGRGESAALACLFLQQFDMNVGERPGGWIGDRSGDNSAEILSDGRHAGNCDQREGECDTRGCHKNASQEGNLLLYLTTPG